MRACILGLASFSMFCFSSARAAEAGEASFVLRAGRIFPVSRDLPWTIEDGIIIVRDGKIVAVGPCASRPADGTPAAAPAANPESPEGLEARKGLALPPDLPVIHLPDAVILPGLVAAATDGGGRHEGDESLGAGYRAVDGFNTYGDFARTLAAGVTTVHLSPGDHRLLTGQGAIVKLAGQRAKRIIVAEADLCVNLGEPVNSPPPLEVYPFPASADVEIEPPELQRPGSRMGQILALEEKIAEALEGRRGQADRFHAAVLAEKWKACLPIRIQADRAVDISSALAFLEARERRGYIVGGAEARKVVEALRQRKVGLVYRPRARARQAGIDLGTDPGALSAEWRDLPELSGIPLALGVPVGQPVEDLRLGAIVACGCGLESRRALESVTRIPAEILGVSDRVGSLAPGRDADFLVMSGDPLRSTSHVLEVLVDGVPVFKAPRRDALVVRGGTIWLGPGREIDGGEILVEDGKISAVGKTVPHPPHARVVDAGPSGFIAPGFIDASSHLELRGDRGAAGPELDLSRLVGVPDVTSLRVAGAGITTVLVSPYSPGPRGSRLAAVKTAGRKREDRVIRPTAAVAFSARSPDPLAAVDPIRGVLEAGKKYLEAWKKYEKDLAEYLEKVKRGEPVEEKKAPEAQPEEKVEPDPISGLWAGTASGGPIGRPVSGMVAARLKGNQVQARLVSPKSAEEARFVGTLDGKKITGRIEVDTGGMGFPTVEAEIVGPDAVAGKASFMGQTVDFNGRRVRKESDDAVASRGGPRRRGGRPQPPRTDEALEPIRALLEGKIPAVVDASTPAHIREVLKLFLEENKIPVVLLNAEGAHQHADRLSKEKVGVILPLEVVRSRLEQDFHQGDQLSRRGVPMAFQSAAEDGARDLPLRVLHAVERGLSADAALAALTIDAARMYKIDDRVGSIEPGRDADLVIFRGHPFLVGGLAERVFIRGEEVKP